MRLISKYLGLVDYMATWQAMQTFTEQRTPDTDDELWLLEHPPIYTLGQAGQWKHLLKPSSIPVVQIDRGGQITYHAPGQLIAYTLLDLRRRSWSIRHLIRHLEQAIIKLLANYGINANGNEQAPGVYVEHAKIAALGLRIRQGCCFHGLALNVNMDLEPFAWINPCGQPNMRMTQMANFGVDINVTQLAAPLSRCLQQQLAYAQEPLIYE